MSAQTQLQPCEFCGEPSVEEIVVIPAVYEPIEGVRSLKKRATKAWVCVEHKQAVETDSGWQERQRIARKALRDDLKARTEESPLFDPGPQVAKRKRWEDVA